MVHLFIVFQLDEELNFVYLYLMREHKNER